MKRKKWLSLALRTSNLAASEKSQYDIKNFPAPNGLLPDGSPPRQDAPRAPDPGTYTGSNPNPRPPISRLNADPSNPSGAPAGTR